MDGYIDRNSLRIKCNIQISQIRHLSISESIGNHISAELSADIESDSLDLSGHEVSGQPIKLCYTENGSEHLIFFGVVGRIYIEKQSSYDIVHILSYSVSWLMDLEEKNRSFQKMAGQPVGKMIRQIADENEFSLIFSGKDKVNPAPFIQYRETDWKFLLRLASNLHLPVLAAGDHAGKGIYIGFKEDSIPVDLEVSKEIWKMDADYISSADWKSVAGTYFEVTTGQILHLGQSVMYKNEQLWIQKVSMVLEKGIIQCTYQLARKNYHAFLTFCNPHIKGVSLTGTVLERLGETVKIHLDIDREQNIGEAFPYLWLPEHGNMMYCMPEIGSRIRLLVPGEDETNAIGIHCVRQNGQICKETQNPDLRWFVTNKNKKMTLQPSSIKITTDHDKSSVILQDRVGSIFRSGQEILIQAKGRLHIRGAKVKLAAPTEVTVVKRQLGSPAVVNLCHNLDSLGRHSTFRNLKSLKEPVITAPGKGTAGSQTVMNRMKKGEAGKEKEKRAFKMKELMGDSSMETVYELGASVMNVISAIPQPAGQDKISQIALGARTVTGRMKGR